MSEKEITLVNPCAKCLLENLRAGCWLKQEINICPTAHGPDAEKKVVLWQFSVQTETARLHSINMIMNEPHVFIKGFCIII